MVRRWLLPALISASAVVLDAQLAKLPFHFRRRYNWDSPERISEEQLQLDLEDLRRGADTGFPLVVGPGGRVSDGQRSHVVGGKLSDILRWWFRALDREKETDEFEFQTLSGLEEMRRDQEEQMRQRQRRLEEDIRRHRAQLREEERLNSAAQRAWEAEQQRMRFELEAQRRRLDEERQRRQRSFAFASMRDPLLCPLDALGNPLEAHCINYTGPASIMCYDRSGSLQSIDFVGVCDEDGTNCQSQDAYWVGEQWRLHLVDGAWQWKYRNVTGSHVANVSCANDWSSEMAPTSQPSGKWLEAFNDGPSFLLHELQPRIMPGPTFDFIWKQIKTLSQHDVDFDREHAGQWINAMLMMQGYATSDKMSARQHRAAKQTLRALAQYTVFYGLVAHSGASST